MVTPADDQLARRRTARSQIRGQPLDRRRREGREHREGPEQAQLADVDDRMIVRRPEAAPAQRDDDRKPQTGHDECRAHADQRDQDRHGDGPDGEHRVVEAFERAEDAAERMVRRDPLEHRPARDVHQAPADAGEHEEPDRDRGVGNRTDHREWDAPEQEAHDQRACQAVAPDQQRRGRRTDQTPGADRGPEEADAALAHREQVEGQDDCDHIERSLDDTAGGNDQHDRSRARMTDEGPQAVDHSDRRRFDVDRAGSAHRGIF